MVRRKRQYTKKNNRKSHKRKNNRSTRIKSNRNIQRKYKKRSQKKYKKKLGIYKHFGGGKLCINETEKYLQKIKLWTEKLSYYNTDDTDCVTLVKDFLNIESYDEITQNTIQENLKTSCLDTHDPVRILRYTKNGVVKNMEGATLDTLYCFNENQHKNRYKYTGRDNNLYNILTEKLQSVMEDHKVKQILIPVTITYFSLGEECGCRYSEDHSHNFVLGILDNKLCAIDPQLIIRYKLRNECVRKQRERRLAGVRNWPSPGLEWVTKKTKIREPKIMFKCNVKLNKCFVKENIPRDEKLGFRVCKYNPIYVNENGEVVKADITLKQKGVSYRTLGLTPFIFNTKPSINAFFDRFRRPFKISQINYEEGEE